MYYHNYIRTMKSNIIPGYKGVMPLDLSGVDPQYHKILIDQHNKDINAYNAEQDKLPHRLRYENDVGKAIQCIKNENEIIYKRIMKRKL